MGEEHKLTVGTTYYFQVRGKDSSNNAGPESDTVNAIQRATPPAVLGLKAAGGGDGTVTLTWNDYDNDYYLTSYEYRQYNGSVWDSWTPTTSYTEDTSTDPDTFSLELDSLTNGVAYSFQVRGTNIIPDGDGATDDTKYGPDGDTVTATPSGPPAAPADLRATPQNGKVRLFWTDPLDSTITKYQYQYGLVVTGSETVWEPLWTDVPKNADGTLKFEITLSNLTNGAEYEFQVRAISDGGSSDASSATATPTSSPRAPSQMSNVSHTVTGVSSGAGGKVRFTWDDPSESFINQYQYRYNGGSSNPGEGNWDLDWTPVPSSIATTTSYPTSTDGTESIPGSSVHVFYELRAVNTSPEPDLEGPATAITVSRTNTPGISTEPPGAPTGLTAAPTPNQVALTWTVPSGTASVTGYQYRQSSSQDDNGNAVWDPDWTDISDSDSATAAHTLTSITDGITYTFEVRATNNKGTAEDTDDDIHGAAASVGPVTPGAPGVPTGLAVATEDDTATGSVNEAPTETSLYLSWAAPTAVTGVAVGGYEYRKRATADTEWGEWEEVAGSDDSTTSHTATDLSAGTSYDFQVRAMAAETIGGPASNIASGTTASPPPPRKPSGLSAAGVANGVKLTWTNPNDDTITIYRYRQATSEAGLAMASWTPFSNDPELTEYIITRLTAGTTYYFQILAANAKGDGPESDAVSATSQAAGDGTWSYRVDVRPGAFTAGSTEGARVTLVATWTADSADRGNIVSLAVNGTGSVQAEVESASPQLVGFGISSTGDLSADSGSNVAAPGSCESDTDKGEIKCTIELTSGSRALFAAAPAKPVPNDVKARLSTDFSMTAVVNGVATTANTPASDPAGSLRLVKEAEPRPPTRLRVTSRDNRQVTLAWDNPGNPTIDRYEYQTTFNTDSNDDPVWPSSWSRMSPSNADTEGYTVRGLTNNNRYHFRIRAVNLQSETGTTQSYPSNVVRETPNPRPSAPRNLKAETQSRNVKLTWDEPRAQASLTGYQWRRSADGGQTWDPDWPAILRVLIFGPGDTEAFEESLVFHTEYSYQLRAVNDVGPGPAAGVTVTARPRGLVLGFAQATSSCTGKSDGAGFGTDVTIDNSVFYAFDIFEKGIDATDGSQWWRVEYLESVSGDLDVVLQAWFPGECFGPVSSHVSQAIPATWPPVMGEWKFEAAIDPNPLESGNTDGSKVTFTATFDVTRGDPEELSLHVGGVTKLVGAQLTGSNDDGRVGVGDTLANQGSWTTADSHDISNDDCEISDNNRQIECILDVLEGNKLFAAANATPGSYELTITLTDFVLTAQATTAEHTTAFAVAAEDSDDHDIVLQLEVIPGPPPAPKNLLASDDEHTRTTLTWEDPKNPNITGYEYQQTTTQPGITLSWTGSSDDTIANWQYRKTTVEPGIVLSWPHTAGAEGYQYRHTTTEPGITLTWDASDSSVTKYEYRHTTAVDATDPDNPVPDFPDSWQDVPDSGDGGANRGSYKVTGLVLDKTHYFEVRPDTGGTPGDAVTPGQTAQGFPTQNAGWTNVPSFAVEGSPEMAESKITADDIPGLDLYGDNYFEVRTIVDGGSEDAVIPTKETVNFVSDALDWDDIPDSTAAKTTYKVTGFDIRIPHWFEVRPVSGATPLTDTTPSVTLSWTTPDLPGETISKYQYRHSTDGDFQADGLDWTDFPSSDSSTTTFTPTSVDLSTPNHWEVRPFTTEAKDAVSFTTVASAALTWADPGDSDITGYQYRQSTDGATTWGDWIDISGSSATTITHTVDGLDLSTSHGFEVRATGLPDRGPVDQNPLHVDNFQGASSQTIPDSAPGEANALSYDVTGLGNGVTYYFRIFAVTDGGASGPSNTASATTVLGAPAAPTGLTAEPANGQVTLEWDNPGDSSITKYQYRQGDSYEVVEIDGVNTRVPVWPTETDPDDNTKTVGTWTDIPGSGATTTSYTVSGLDNDRGEEQVEVVYAFQVRAVNQKPGETGADAPVDQFSDASETVQANPGFPLDAPVGFGNTSWKPSQGILTVFWDEYTNDLGESLYPGAEFEVSWTSPHNSGSMIVAPETNSSPPPLFLPATEAEILVGADFGRYTIKIRGRHNYGPWSTSVSKTRTVGPFIEGSNATREVDQWAGEGANVGKPVTARVIEGYDVTYSMRGSNLFAIDQEGQISVAGTITARAYPVTVVADIRKPGTIGQADRHEQPITINVTSTGPWYEMEIMPAPVSGSEFGFAVDVISREPFDETVSDVTTTAGLRLVVVTSPGFDGEKGRVRVHVDEPEGGIVHVQSAPTPTANERFGHAVAIQEDTLVVGGNAATGSPGQVYVYTPPAEGLDHSAYRWNGGLGDPVVLTTGGTNPTDSFGKAVDIDGDTIVVGAPTHNIPGSGFPPLPTPLGGIAYIFQKRESGWPTTPTAKLEVAGRPAIAALGSAAVVSGDNVIVGAPGEDKVYVFAKPPGGWTDTDTPTRELSGPEGSAFGSSIAIDGRNLVIGAPGEGAGAAYVFTGSGSSWSQRTKLTGLGSDSGDQFGHAVAIDGDRLAVSRGNQADNDLAGSVQVFRVNGGTPLVLTASDGAENHFYGASVALAGDWLAVGATGYGFDADLKFVQIGAEKVYVFQADPIMDDSPGKETVRRAEADEEITVETPDGKVTVTIPANARDEGYLISVDSNNRDCTPRPDAPGQELRVCADVNLYDLDGEPIDPATIDEDATISIDLGFSNQDSFRVFKRSSPGQPWVEIPNCRDTSAPNAECYNPDPDRSTFINIGGISSFSQYGFMGRPTARPPSAPRDLQAVSGNQRVTLSWTAPSNRGSSVILRYQFSLDGGSTWNDVPGSDADTTSHVVRPLRNGTLYSFAVRAVNGAGAGPASNIVNVRPRSTSRDSGGRRVGGGAVSAHVPPTFDEGNTATRHIVENASRGTRIGNPLLARDPLGRKVTYTKAGPDAALFDVASQTGQIFVKRGTILDFESSRKTYLIEVIGNTGVGGPGRIAVTIVVQNVAEPGRITLSPDTPPEVDAEITAALSDPDGGINGVSWQWQRSSDGRTWNDIPGAISANYTPTEADRGLMLRASVSYNDAAAPAISLESMAIGPVPMPPPPLPADRPGSIALSPEGTPEVGTEITATLTDPDGGVTGETWQWQRSADGVTWTAIDGATAASYTPVEADVGMMLRANVSYSDAVAARVSLVSATTGTVAAPVEIITPTPTPTRPAPTPTPTPRVVLPVRPTDTPPVPTLIPTVAPPTPTAPTPTATMLPTPPPTDAPPTPTAITSEVTPTEAPPTPVAPEEGGFPAWLIVVIIIGLVIIVAGVIIIVRARMQQ